MAGDAGEAACADEAERVVAAAVDGVDGCEIDLVALRVLEVRDPVERLENALDVSTLGRELNAKAPLSG